MYLWCSTTTHLIRKKNGGLMDNYTRVHCKLEGVEDTSPVV